MAPAQVEETHWISVVSSVSKACGEDSVGPWEGSWVNQARRLFSKGFE